MIKIVVYKREKHQPSDQYVPYLRDLLNVSNGASQAELLNVPEEMVQGPSKKLTAAEEEILRQQEDTDRIGE